MSATREQRWPILEGIALTGFGTSAVLTRELKDALREEAQSLLAARDALLREREERERDASRLAGAVNRELADLRDRWNMAETKLAEAQREIERLGTAVDVWTADSMQSQLRIRELEAQLQSEQQADIAIAAACLCTGVVPAGTAGTVDAVRAVCDKLAASEEARKRAEEKLARLRETVRRAHSLLIHVEDVERYSGWDAIKKARALLAEADQKGKER